MGGNALKNCVTRRYQADEFALLADEVLHALRRDFPDRRAALLPAYRSKADFGDMDVLMETAPVGEIRRWAVDTWNPAEVSANGNVISFECRQLQVDLIGQSPENFDTALAYYSWNDLGNLLGRIAHKMGVRYGHDGLSVVLRDGNHQFAERVVSKDTDRILSFLGYDPARWRAGFDTLEDIFSFAASTPYFNAAIFDYDNRNHTARVRDRKRANYRGFLEWMEGRTDLPNHPWPSTTELGGRRLDAAALDRLFSAFPEFEHEWRAVEADFDAWRQAKLLFNGEVVSGLTGLTDRDLGRFMRHLKEIKEQGPGFHRWLAGAGADGVRRWVESEFSVWSAETGTGVGSPAP